jgi:uncharacterized membrane protein
MDALPEIVPRLPRERRLGRGLAPSEAFVWLRAGWSDITGSPGPSLIYGLAVFGVSIVLVGGMLSLNLDYILFPALAGFLVVGPALAIGLYEKSRRTALGEQITLREMVFVKAASGGQILFTGAVLSILMLLWLRAAVLLYALFFGLKPFPGLDHIVPTLISTSEGWGLLVTGSLVGGLFAAFSFAIGAFSIPMLLNERIDAFTAMGTSLVMVWANLPVMLMWGTIVMIITGINIATGLLGFIVTFPLLGHATWHAYIAMKD